MFLHVELNFVNNHKAFNQKIPEGSNKEPSDREKYTVKRFQVQVYRVNSHVDTDPKTNEQVF